MSILLESDFGWIISHENFFQLRVPCPKSLSDDKKDDLENVKLLKLNPLLFNITEPFKETIRIKGKKVKSVDQVELSETTKSIKQVYEKILCLPESNTIFSISGTRKHESDPNSAECENAQNGNIAWPKNNFDAVKTAEDFFKTVRNLELPKFYGRNHDPNLSVISEVRSVNVRDGESRQTHQFIFPQNSTFHCKDVSEMSAIFGDLEMEDRFDLIIMDPPWWNKFIRRKKRKQYEAGYQMMENDELEKLPIKNILKDDGIIVIWCTNAKSHHEAVRGFFRAWDVKFHLKLYWVKITKSGLPVCPFNEENKKQPYEAILIGRRGNSFDDLSDKSTKLVISVPSSINSHKPPLTEVLKSLYPNKAFSRKLEIFARYLLPDFTSFGNEVIKLQHSSLYIECENK